MVLECDICNALVNSELIASYVDENPYDWMDSCKYSFGKCPQCSSPFIAKQKQEFIAGQAEWGMQQKIYPSNLFHINPVIPEKLRNSLAECIECYKSNSSTATVIMCRRTVEGFCQIKGVKEGNLSNAIKKLKEQGLINEQLFEWANELRIAGNEAAHNIDFEFSNIDAKDILDFTIAILDYTFSFKEKFENFKERVRKR